MHIVSLFLANSVAYGGPQHFCGFVMTEGEGPGSPIYHICTHSAYIHTCTNKVLHCFGSQLFFDNFGSIWIHDDNLWCQLTLLLEYIAGFIYMYLLILGVEYSILYYEDFEFLKNVHSLVL